jgi:hypothetical protein
VSEQGKFQQEPKLRELGFVMPHLRLLVISDRLVLFVSFRKNGA